MRPRTKNTELTWVPATLDGATHNVPTDLVQVIVSWGTSILKIAHVKAQDGFALGTARSKEETIQFPADPALLGSSYLQLNFVQEAGSIFVVIPEQASSHLTRTTSRSITNQIQTTEFPPQLHGARLEQLALDLVVEIALPGLNLSLSLAPAANAFPWDFWDSFDLDGPKYFAASASVFACLLGALAFFVPPLGLNDETHLDRERLFLISQYLDAASERELKQTEQPMELGEQAAGASGERAAGREGEAGKPDRPRVNKRITVKGPSDNRIRTLSRQELLAEAAQSGMIGLLTGDRRAEADLALVSFNRDHTLGDADLTAQASFWGDEPGESGGWGGLGLLGDGFSGGDLAGHGHGVGIASVGTIGPGGGNMGRGPKLGRDLGGRATAAPQLRLSGQTEVSGRLPAQVIQRIVRQNFGRFRLCYEQGLAKNPLLEGRVSVRFVIGNDGAVSAVSAAGDLADQGTKSCVAAAFYGLSFPSPENGIVKVNYPLMFTPQ